MDEDGVDVVEAIDAWIDEQIDDLSDDELESILGILDAVSASVLANLDADDVYTDDVNQMVDEAGGSAEDRAFADAVLRAAFFGEPFEETIYAAGDHAGGPDDPGLELDADPDDDRDEDDEDLELDDFASDSDDAEDGGFSEIQFLDESELDHDNTANDDEDLADNGDDQDTEQDEDTEDTEDTEDREENGVRDHSENNAFSDLDFLADLKSAHSFDDELGNIREFPGGDGIDGVDHNDFLADLAGTSPAAAAEIVSAATPKVALRPFDNLGPTFLPEPVVPVKRRRHRRSLGRFILPTFMIFGLAVFAFGMMQLINSLDEDVTEATAVAAELRETPTAAPEATAAPDALEPTAGPIDPSAPVPTATAVPPTPSRIGIRLVTGDVMVATYAQAGTPPEITLLYGASEDFAPAIDFAWLDGGVGIVDTEGNVLVVDPDARRPLPKTIYEAGGGFGEAVEIASVEGLVAIRTKDGNINLTPSNGRADPDVIQLVWDAEAEGAAATDLTSVGGLLPFVLDDGNAQMVATADNNAVVPLWSADEQPPAFNVAASPTGILLGVGQGAVARYRLGDLDGSRFESVWDPFSGDEQPAIGYSPAGDSTAIILGDGTIVLTESDSGGRLLWDPTETEIRAFVAVGDNDHVVVLLESGSVVRIPLDADGLIESIWDITDETLSPANQLVVEPAAIVDS